MWYSTFIRNLTIEARPRHPQVGPSHFRIGRMHRRKLCFEFSNQICHSVGQTLHLAARRALVVAGGGPAPPLLPCCAAESQKQADVAKQSNSTLDIRQTTTETESVTSKQR